MEYNRISLAGLSVGGDGYFVVAQDGTVADADLIDASADWQNGADQVQLDGKRDLQVLDLRGTQVRDISGVLNFTRLKMLDISGIEEVNGLINRGGKVMSIEPGGAIMRKLGEDLGVCLIPSVAVVVFQPPNIARTRADNRPVPINCQC